MKKPPENGTEEAGVLMDPEIGILGDGVAAAAAAGPLPARAIVFPLGVQQAEGPRLVRLSLVEGQGEQSSRSVPLRRREERRRSHRSSTGFYGKRLRFLREVI